MTKPRISLEEASQVAILARLELSEEELETYRAQLDAILEYMAELDRIDVSEVEPTHHALAAATPLRDDRVAPSLSREEVLEQAPGACAEGFAVPRVVES